MLNQQADCQTSQKIILLQMDGKLSEPSTANPTTEQGRPISVTTELELQLSKIPFFESVKKQNGMMNFTRVALSLTKLKCSQGEEIFHIEKTNRSFLYVVEGVLAIYGQPLNPKDVDSIPSYGTKLIALLYKDGYCGNSEAMNGCRITRIVAAQKALVYVIPLPAMFISFKGLINFPELDEQVQFLQKVSLFEEMDLHSLQKLIVASQFLNITKGTKIYEENQPATHIYIVFSGTFEINRRISEGEIPSHSLQLSCVSVYQILGAEDVMLEAKTYSETVHCISLKGSLLKIAQQKLMAMIHNKKKMIRLCKSRENWKKDRIQLLQKTFVTQFPIESANRKKRIMSSTTFSKKLRPHTQPTQNFESIEIERCISRRSHISNKKTQFFRSEEEYLNHKYEQMERISTNNKLKSVFELNTKSTEKMPKEKVTRNMSELILTKFLNKKHKIQNKMIFDYLKTRPPELVFNPNKEFAVFKPLHVTESSAIRNRKKVNQLIKSKYFKPMYPNAIGL